MRSRSFGLLAALGLSACQTLPAPVPDSPGASASASARAGVEWRATWTLDAARSTAIDPWRSLAVETAPDADGGFVVKRMWRGSREGGAFVDSVRLVVGRTVQSEPMGQWADNRHLGAYVTGDRRKTVASHWRDDGRTLVTESELTVSVQQGTHPVRIYTEYRLSPEGDRLDVVELRSTRPRPIHYVFARAD